MSGIAFNTSGSGLTRSGAFVSNASSWTRLGWFNPTTANPSGGHYRTYFLYGDTSFTNPYIWMGSNNDTGDCLVEIFNGSTYIDSVTTTVPLDAWFTWALVYNSVAHTLAFYVNETLRHTFSVNLSTIVFVQTTENIGTSDYAEWSDIGAAQFRVWQSFKTAGPLYTEWASATVVDHTALLAATPLTGPADLTDTSGNGRDWSVVGSAGSSVAGPFVSGGPSTCSAAIPITLPMKLSLDTTGFPSDPSISPTCSTSFAAVWFSYHNASASAKRLSVRMLGSTYYSDISAWSGTCGSLTQVACGSYYPEDAIDTNDLVFTVVVPAGQTYYLLSVDSDSFRGGALKIAIVEEPAVMMAIAGMTSDFANWSATQGDVLLAIGSKHGAQISVQVATGGCSIAPTITSTCAATRVRTRYFSNTALVSTSAGLAGLVTSGLNNTHPFTTYYAPQQTIEAAFKLSSAAGVADGAYYVWINGVLVDSATGLTTNTNSQNDDFINTIAVHPQGYLTDAYVQKDLLTPPAGYGTSIARSVPTGAWQYWPEAAPSHNVPGISQNAGLIPEATFVLSWTKHQAGSGFRITWGGPAATPQPSSPTDADYFNSFKQTINPGVVWCTRSGGDNFLTYRFGHYIIPVASCIGGGEISVVADPPDGTPFIGRNLNPRLWLKLDI
jgi:hypothetical protein